MIFTEILSRCEEEYKQQTIKKAGEKNGFRGNISEF